MSDEQYEGWKNRETWAFWLHVTNDQGWYESVREFVQAQPLEDAQDWQLGEQVVGYVKEALDESVGHGDYSPRGTDRTMRDDIGSWWRIDYAEIGAAARDLASDL